MLTKVSATIEISTEYLSVGAAICSATFSGVKVVEK
jgi:hypothetical protein